MPMTAEQRNELYALEKTKRAMTRSIENEHDRIEEILAPLKSEYDTLRAKMLEDERRLRAIEARMDTAKEKIHLMRLNLADVRAKMADITGN